MIRLGLVIVLGALLSNLQAQTSPPKGEAASSSNPSGFSIETEMLTYRALESNTEAIACDVAAFLSGSPARFTDSAGGFECNIKINHPDFVVVLLPIDKGEFAGFQIWRSDMASMDRLQRIAAREGCETVEERTSSRASTSPIGSLLSATPAGPPLAIAQSVLGLMASEESASSVGGTIQDQAFMNGVGRALRSLNIPVVMPTVYPPFSLALLNESKSPFLASFVRTLAARECLSDLAAKPETTDRDRDRINSIISDITAFMATLADSNSPGTRSIATKAADANSAQGRSQNNKTGAGANNEPSEGQNAVPGTTFSQSHFAAIISADGLAIKLGVDPATGTFSPDMPSPHILLIKALESGGSVLRHSNIFGTKLRYSGGSVGTFSLFSMDGDLECSGNVYEFGGALQAKEFEKNLRDFHPNPGEQVIFRRGGCKPQ